MPGYQGGCAYSPVVLEIGDIQIGAVELKDTSTDLRANVIAGSGGKNRLCVDAGAILGGKVQSIATTAALGGSGTFTTPSYDCQSYAGFAASLNIQRAVADTNVQVVVEHSYDNAHWFAVDTLDLGVTAAIPAAGLSRVYAPVRRYMRVTITNLTLNPLTTTELVITLMPIT